MDKYQLKSKKRMALIEAVCKKLCKNAGIDPDQLVCMEMPAFFKEGLNVGYLVPDPNRQIPAWWSYRMIVDETLRQLENANSR